ncbi:FAD-binding domain-containing protein [Polyplosphaeria fusca]|uniref:FAD-binding domain-containing protein n=1 Tax=Polyplosphaeria fusca TaxID=682080 RepID=A0A9P4V1N7_9PLEO|nr:FAD-binding domain-containing protein [Polyplosphaeria fusca]
MHLSTRSLLTSLFLGVAVAYSNVSESTCEHLSKALGDEVFYPESPAYNASITSYPFIQLRLEPACVLKPESAEDVSKAVKVLRKSRKSKFAVRGGGHNANVGYNNIIDGATIDMRNVSKVEIVGDVVQVGAGAIWQQVYDEISPHNISVMGGRIGVVGVGGFLTGGGISFFSPELGWSCDYVQNFQIVLATGEIVNANATSKPELFAALKGGQSNFGIVTRFDLKHFPVGNLWGGRVAFAPTADNDLIEAFTNLKNPDNFDPYAAGWVTNRYNGTAKTFTPTAIIWYTKAESAPGAWKNVSDIEPKVMNGLTTAPLVDFARNASMVVKTQQTNTIWATTTFRMTPTLAHSIHKKWKALIPKVAETYPGIVSELTFQSLAKVPDAATPNSFGFSADSHPEKDGVFLQIIFYFMDASYLPGLESALADFINIFDNLSEAEGAKSKFVYLNFAAAFQEPLKSYGESELWKLRRTSKKYDPEGFFQRQLPGGFKLFNETDEHYHHWW